MSSPLLSSLVLVDLPEVYNDGDTTYDGAVIETLHKVVRRQLPGGLLALGIGLLPHPDETSFQVSASSGLSVSIAPGAAILGGDVQAPCYVEVPTATIVGPLPSGRGPSNPIYLFVALLTDATSPETADPRFFVADTNSCPDGKLLATIQTDSGLSIVDGRQFLSLGTGDMTKAVYDTNNNGKVDRAELSDVTPWSGISDKPDTFPPSEHTHTAGDISDAGAAGTAVLQAATEADARDAMGAASAEDLSDHVDATAPHAGHLNIDGSKALTGDLNAGGNLLTNLADPVNPTDAVTKAYADASGAGIKPKTAVKVASPINVNVSNPGTSTFDTVVLTSGDFIALVNQTTASENGVYVFNGPSSALTRRADLDSAGTGEMETGVVFKVSFGASYAGRSFILVTLGTITLGTTALEFTQWGADATVDNDATNVGDGGGMFYKAKAGISLLFRRLKAASNKLSVSTDTDNVLIDVNEGNLTLGNLGGTLPVEKGGTGFTALTDVKTWLGITSIDATKLQGRDVAATAPTVGEAIVWSGTEWAPGAAGTGDLRADGTIAMTAPLDSGMQRLVNVGTPVASTDGATKGYVDTMATRRLLPSVRVATAAALSAWTRDPTNSNKLVANANGALSIDGVAVTAGDRVLVCREGAGPLYSSNASGIYTVAATGDASHPWALLRATDADSATELAYGTSVAVQAGATFGGYQFVQSTLGTLTLNSTALYWSDTPGAAGTGGGGGVNIVPSLPIPSSAIQGQLYLLPQSGSDDDKLYLGLQRTGGGYAFGLLTPDSFLTGYKPTSGAIINTGLSISSGLVLSLPFNEGSGTTINDKASSPSNGTLSSSGMWVTDSGYDNVLSFAGTNGSVPHNSKFNIETFSIAFAFKSSYAGSYATLFQKPATGGTKYVFSLYLGFPGTGQIEFAAFDGSHNPTADTTGTYNDNAWHKCVLTKTQGGTLRLYIDGILRATATDSTTSGGTTNTGDLILGYETGGTHAFSGQIAYFHMWNRELTGAPGSIGSAATGEIAALATDEFAMYR